MAEFSDFEDEEGVEEPVLTEEERSEIDEEEIKDNPLIPEVVADNLSLICKTGNGLAHAYVRLDVHQKDSYQGKIASKATTDGLVWSSAPSVEHKHTEFLVPFKLMRDITDISILKHFIHLRYVDLSHNKIRDIAPLNFLTELLTLKLDKNILKSAKLNELPYLQQADFSHNKISDLEGITHPLLDSLNLSNNDISEVGGLEFKRLTRLTSLEIRANKLTSTKGLYLPNVKKLYLADNNISVIEDLSILEHLTTLYLGGNNISKLDGFTESLKNLQYLNLRKNEIAEMSELNKLKPLPMLRALILRENPVCYEEGYRIEVLVILRRLERLDQDVYLEDERQEAEEIYNQRAEAEGQSQPGAVEVIQSEEDD